MFHCVTIVDGIIQSHANKATEWRETSHKIPLRQALCSIHTGRCVSGSTSVSACASSIFFFNLVLLYCNLHWVAAERDQLLRAEQLRAPAACSQPLGPFAAAALRSLCLGTLLSNLLY